MSDYLNRVWGFIKWHKKKLIALGSVTVLGVGGYYYAKRMLLDGMRQVEELGRGIQERMMESQHRQNEQVRIKAESQRMLLTFVPPLRASVKQFTDPAPVTKKLKEVRMKRKALAATVTDQQAQDPAASMREELEVAALWDELKVMSLTRLVASVYALALLNALLRIQLHVLGRNAFEEAAEHRRQGSSSVAANAAASAGPSPLSPDGDAGHHGGELTEDGSAEPLVVTRKVRERFLFSGSDHLLNTGHGLRTLVGRVHDSIKEASKGWLMGTDGTVSRWEVLDMLDAIRARIETQTTQAGTAAEPPQQQQRGGGGGSGELHLSAEAREWLAACLIPDDERPLLQPDDELDASQNQMCKAMLEEALDAVECPLFFLALQQSLDALFDVLRREVQARPVKDDNALPQRQEQLQEQREGGGAEQGETRFLLTKVIVNLKQCAGDVLADGSKAEQGDPTASVAGSAGAGGGDDSGGVNEYQRALTGVPALDELCSAVFQQGAEEAKSSNPFDALGLGDLGLGDDDLQSLAGLLSGLGGGGTGGGMVPNEAQLMKLLGGAEQGGLATGMPGVNDEAMMSMLQQMVQQGGAPSPIQPR